MAHTSRGSFRRLPARSRRQSSWALGPGGTTIQAFSSTTDLLVGSGAVVNFDGLTLIRLRGRLFIQIETATSGGAGFTGAFGIAIATAEAFAAGAGSLRTPLGDQSWDGWFYHTYFQVVASSAIIVSNAADEGLQGGMRFLSLEVDSKAMRKLKIQDTVYAMLSVVETGTATAHIAFDSRTLIKLP